MASMLSLSLSLPRAPYISLSRPHANIILATFTLTSPKPFDCTMKRCFFGCVHFFPLSHSSSFCVCVVVVAVVAFTPLYVRLSKCCYEIGVAHNQ